MVVGQTTCGAVKNDLEPELLPTTRTEDWWASSRIIDAALFSDNRSGAHPAITSVRLFGAHLEPPCPVGVQGESGPDCESKEYDPNGHPEEECPLDQGTSLLRQEDQCHHHLHLVRLHLPLTTQLLPRL